MTTMPDSSSILNSPFLMDQALTEGELILVHDYTMSTATTSAVSNSTRDQTSKMDNDAYCKVCLSNWHAASLCPYMKNNPDFVCTPSTNFTALRARGAFLPRGCGRGNLSTSTQRSTTAFRTGPTPSGGQGHGQHNGQWNN